MSWSTFTTIARMSSVFPSLILAEDLNTFALRDTGALLSQRATSTRRLASVLNAFGVLAQGMANTGTAKHDGRRPHLLNENVLFIVGFLVIGIIRWLTEVESGSGFPGSGPGPDGSGGKRLRRAAPPCPSSVAREDLWRHHACCPLYHPPQLVILQSIKMVRPPSRVYKRHAPIPDRKECNRGCHFAGISHGTGLVLMAAGSSLHCELE